MALLALCPIKIERDTVRCSWKEATMNQVKIGEFLRELRKGKGLTQEQLAEQFNISRRSVSRWETGSNMPDVGLLIEIADFFEVDIREIIDGQRKSENMDKEKETLKKVAEYADTEKAKLKKKVSNIFKWMCLMMLGSVLIGFFANQLDTILGCVCFTLGIILLVGLSMLMSKQDQRKTKTFSLADRLKTTEDLNLPKSKTTIASKNKGAMQNNGIAKIQPQDIAICEKLGKS